MSAIDSLWPPLRQQTDVHLSWRWKEMVAGAPEFWGVVQIDAGEVPLAAWCSSKRSPISLQGEKYYRLDYFEIHPAYRGGILGMFTLGLIATRALERGATGVVLATLPINGLERFYSAAGAQRAAPDGWSWPSNLVAFTLHFDVLEALRDQAEGFRTR